MIFNLNQPMRQLLAGRTTNHISLPTITSFLYRGYNEHWQIPNQLQYLEVGLLYSNVCSEVYHWMINGSIVCSFMDEGKGFCFGDSGSPLVRNGKLLAIATSLLYGCGKGWPDLYTLAPYYRKWIEETIGVKREEEKTEVKSSSSDTTGFKFKFASSKSTSFSLNFG